MVQEDSWSGWRESESCAGDGLVAAPVLFRMCKHRIWPRLRRTTILIKDPSAYTHTNWRTHTCTRVRANTQTYSSHATKSFWAADKFLVRQGITCFYGTRNLITLFIKAPKWAFSFASYIDSTFYFIKIYFYIIPMSIIFYNFFCCVVYLIKFCIYNLSMRTTYSANLSVCFSLMKREISWKVMLAQRRNGAIHLVGEKNQDSGNKS